jgi:hypothetical protein
MKLERETDQIDVPYDAEDLKRGIGREVEKAIRTLRPRKE